MRFAPATIAAVRSVEIPGAEIGRTPKRPIQAVQSDRWNHLRAGQFSRDDLGESATRPIGGTVGAQVFKAKNGEMLWSGRSLGAATGQQYQDP